jgi:tetrahydromethanopterin S-methyltransferase subunit B
MAKKVEVDIEVKSNLEGSIAELKELKKQLKQTAAGSDEFKKLYGQIDDLEDKIKSAKGASADWVDTLESAGGPLGALGGAINKAKVATQSFGAAFKAIGIGLLVSLIAGLVGAFTQTEGSMKKLEPIMTAFEKILGGIFEAIQPILDAFIDLATKALPYVTDGIKILYASLVGLFTLVKEGGGAIGKILKGIFTLDMDVVNEGYEDLKGTWDKTVTAFNKSTEDFDKGYAKQTKSQKKSAEDANAIADKALADKLKRMETDDKLDEAKLAKLKAEAMALAFSEEQKLAVEQAFYEKSYQLKLKDIEDKQKLYKKDSNEYKELEAAKITLQAEGIEKNKEFNEKSAAIRKENGQKIVDFEIQLAKDLQKIEDDKLAKQILALEDETRLDEARLKVLSVNSKEYFDAQRKLENDLYAEKIKKAKGNAKLIEAIELEHKANLKNIDQSEFEAKKDLQLQIANLYGGFGKALQELAGKNKGLAIAGLLIEQAAGVAAIIINTQKVASKAGYVSPLGIATLVAGAAGVVAAVVATKKGIDQINATQVPGGGGAGGANMQAPLPAYSSGMSTSIPTINTEGGANPATQISQTIQNAQSAPIKAYVVSGEIASQQQLDRKANRGATFNLG